MLISTQALALQGSSNDVLRNEPSRRENVDPAPFNLYIFATSTGVLRSAPQKTVKPSAVAPVIIAFIVVRLFTACGKC